MPVTTPAAFLPGVRRVFDLALGQMLWSRRTVFMAVVVTAPVLLAAALRMAQAADAPARLAQADPVATFGVILWMVYLRFVVPVLGVFYGTALIADEVEERTITYLFTRPLRRGAVLVGKYLAYLVCATLMVLPSVLIVYFVLVPLEDVPASFPSLAGNLALAAAGLAGYGAVFALVGAALKRPLLVGLLFVFGWEPLARALPGYTSRFTVAHYLEALVPYAVPAEDLGPLLPAAVAEPIGAWTAMLGLALLIGGGLALAVRVVESREYVLGQ